MIEGSVGLPLPPSDILHTSCAPRPSSYGMPRHRRGVWLLQLGWEVLKTGSRRHTSCAPRSSSNGIPRPLRGVELQIGCEVFETGARSPN
eukprot:8053862-Pyramimonas_sp.AAC.1